MENQKKKVTIRLSDADFEAFEKKVKQTGLSKEVFMRKLIKDKPIMVRSDDTYFALVHDVSKFLDRMDGVFLASCKAGTVNQEELETARNAIKKLWKAIKDFN